MACPGRGATPGRPGSPVRGPGEAEAVVVGGGGDRRTTDDWPDGTGRSCGITSGAALTTGRRGAAGAATVTDATEFLSVIRYGDVLDIHVFISRIGDSSVTFEFRIHREATAELLARSSQVKVAVNMQTWQKVTIADRLRTAFESCKEA